MSESTPIQIPDSLVKALMDGGHRTVFFLGAGASMDSGLPSGYGLAEEIRYKLQPAHLARIKEWEKTNGRNAGIEHIAQICKEIDGNHNQLIRALPREEWLEAKPHEGHTVLAELWTEALADEPLTTNMDTLIEKGFGMVLGRQGNACSQVEHFHRSPPRVFKVHGCLHEEFRTVWALDELQRRDWDEAWKGHVTAMGLMKASAFVFVGFRMALPYLLKTFNEAGKPQAYMVNPAAFEAFRQAPENSAFLDAFCIGPEHYVQAKARDFFEALRSRVHESNLAKHVVMEVPGTLARMDLPPRQLDATAEQLLAQLRLCSPAEFQKMLSRSLLGARYIPLASTGAREMLQSLLLLSTAYTLEVETGRSEPICHLVRNGTRHPLFVAHVGETQLTRQVVTLWLDRAEHWPGDLSPLMVQRPLVITHGTGTLGSIYGYVNVATGKAQPGPWGESRNFIYIHYDELADCIQPQDVQATGKAVRKLVEGRLEGAQT